MMRFGRDDRGSIQDPRRKPPPNYFARGVQMKILVLLFLFMAVLALMSHARKPETWQWMWRLGGKAADTASSTPGDESTTGTARDGAQRDAPPPTDVDTHPARQHVTEQSPAEPVVTSSPRLSARDREEARSWGEDVATAQLDGWDHVLRQLAKSQQELLRQGLWQQRHNQPLTNDEQAEWTRLMQRLQETWDDYHARALLALAQDDGQLTDAQKRLSSDIIQASKSIWEQRSATLAAVAKSQPLTDEQETVLRDLQNLFDQRAFSRIEDNTVLRSAETEAWYRCWERLRTLPPEALAQATGPLTFVQLFSQPKEFRGQLVKVTGTARWAYRVVSREKQFGIDSYIVLGILPGKGTSSPFVTYCVDLPPGFPEIRAADSSEKGSRLDEDLEVTGFFFKRWLHSSAGGMNLSPLILGRITHWDPHADTVRGGAPARVSPWSVALAVLAMALLGTCIAAWVYRSSRWSSTDVAVLPHPPTDLPPFDQTDVQGSTLDTLRDLAQNKGQETNRGPS